MLRISDPPLIRARPALCIVHCGISKHRHRSIARILESGKWEVGILKNRPAPAALCAVRCGIPDTRHRSIARILACGMWHVDFPGWRPTPYRAKPDPRPAPRGQNTHTPDRGVCCVVACAGRALWLVLWPFMGIHPGDPEFRSLGNTS